MCFSAVVINFTPLTHHLLFLLIPFACFLLKSSTPLLLISHLFLFLRPWISCLTLLCWKLFCSSCSAGGGSDQEAGEADDEAAGGAAAHRRWTPRGEQKHSDWLNNCFHSAQSRAEAACLDKVKFSPVTFNITEEKTATAIKLMLSLRVKLTLYLYRFYPQL